MNFLHYFVYKDIEDKKFNPSNTMLELFRKLTTD